MRNVSGESLDYILVFFTIALPSVQKVNEVEIRIFLN